MMRDLGYTVVEVPSGAQALSLLREGLEAHILVTDYLMPSMSGAALVNEMRSAGHRLPVLIVTGYANAGSDIAADIPKLPKPFRQADLATRLHDLLASSSRSEGRASLRVVS